MTEHLYFGEDIEDICASKNILNWTGVIFVLSSGTCLPAENVFIPKFYAVLFLQWYKVAWGNQASVINMQ